jgi:hypothetical protein
VRDKDLPGLLEDGVCHGIDSDSPVAASTISSPSSDLKRTVRQSVFTSMRATCSRTNLRSPTCADPEDGFSFWATRCSLRLRRREAMLMGIATF